MINNLTCSIFDGNSNTSIKHHDSGDPSSHLEIIFCTHEVQYIFLNNLRPFHKPHKYYLWQSNNNLQLGLWVFQLVQNSNELLI